MDNRLKELRKAKRLTQEQLADIIGVSQSLIALIEKGKRDIDFTLAEQLAKAVMQGRDINSTVAEYRRVTVADIKRVASEILQRHRSNTLIYEPAN